MNSNEKAKITKEKKENNPTDNSNAKKEFPKDPNIFETTYEKVLSIINKVKDFIKKNSKTSQQLIEDLEWVIKVITNKSLYTYEVNKSKVTRRNTEMNTFINFVTKYNEEILELNKKHILVSSIFNISKKGEILNKPSLCLKKILPDELKHLDYQKEKEKNERRKISINQIGNVILKLYYKGLEQQKKEKEEKEKAEKEKIDKIQVRTEKKEGKKEEKKEVKTEKKEEKKEVKTEKKEEKKDKKEKAIKIEKVDLFKKYKKFGKKEIKPNSHVLHNSNSNIMPINNTSQIKKINKMNTSKYNNLKRISMDDYMYKKKSNEIRKKIKNKEKDEMESNLCNSHKKDKANDKSQILLNKNLSLTSIKKAMENYYITHINLLESKNKRKSKSIYLDKELNTDQSTIKLNISHKLNIDKNKKYIQINNNSKSKNKPVKIEERIHISSLIDNYFNEIRNITDKDFDIFEFKKKVGYKNVLPIMCYVLLKTLGLLDSKIISLNKLSPFLYTVSDGYKESTLYHNALHGADVTQSLTLFVIQTNAEEISESTVLDLLGLAISAMGHDLGHPGYNNNFHVNASTDLALTYNDSSCLENFHTSFLFKILKKEENNIFEKLGTQNYKSIRKRMISQILATDMANHGEVVSLIRAKIKSSEEELGPGNFNLLSGNEKSKFFEQQMLFNYLIHAADLGHNCKKFEISIKWIEVLCEEFWRQGDMEKSKGIDVSFLCDRDKIDVPASQIGFLRGFILTTFDCLTMMFPIMKYTIENTENNIKTWQEYSAQKRVTGWTPEKKTKNEKNKEKEKSTN